MRIAMTGATGLLGGRLCERLVDDGDEVRGVVRATSDTRRLDALGVETVVASLAPPRALDEALRGVEAVVHAAGGGYARSAVDFYANNLETTRNLVDAAARANVRHFVLISSLAAAGPSRSGAPAEPGDLTRPITHYGRSKAAAERAVLRHRDRMRVTIVRPPAIYGPRDTRMLPLFRAAQRGIVPLPASGRTTSVVHVDDCAEAIRATLRGDTPTGRVYYVEDGEPLPTATMARLLGAAVGRQPTIIRVPRPALVAASMIAETIARITDRPALLTRDKVTDLSQAHWVCSAAMLRDELGWSPRYTFAEGAAHTAQWYLREGWLVPERDRKAPTH